MSSSPSAPFKTAGAWAVAAAVSLLCVVGLAALPAAATADTCENAVVRAQSNSTGLPDCRAYELVSPSYKEGFDVSSSGLSFTDDGLISYRSIGNFADNTQGTLSNPYHARRSTAGWQTSALFPSGLIHNEGGNAPSESRDLRWSLWKMRRQGVADDEMGYWRRGPDGAVSRVGDTADTFGERFQRFVTGASADYSHVVFNHGPQIVSQLYEYFPTGDGFAERPAGVDNLGQFTQSESCMNSVSPDGRVILYTAGCGGGVPALWARVAGSASVAVSGSECTRSASDPGGACNAVSAAAYEGDSADLSRVFFSTSQQLVNGDTDAGNDLYVCVIPPGTPAPVGVANRCDSLIEVSGARDDARVEQVVAISKDGSRVYFVAQGVLADNLGLDDVGPATAADAHNLYVWERDGGDPAGQTRFVARLESPDVSKGQMTPDGRYLLFLTASKLVTSGPGTDDDGAFDADAYRYDVVNRSIVRVSTSISGSGGNGQGFGVLFGAADVSIPAMSADGSTVVFDTFEALSPGDTDGVSDVYSWRDGQVSLISTGGGASVGISASGRDIFFTTRVAVVAGDGNVNNDIYDARLGGGFAVTETVPSCSGDACQGERSVSPGLAVPLAAPPGGGVTEVARAFSLRAVSAAQRRRLAATGKVKLTVSANTAGTVSVAATAVLAGKPARVGSARRRMVEAGRATLTLTLSKRARARLAARGKLAVKVVVSHSRVARGQSVSLRLNVGERS